MKKRFSLLAVLLALALCLAACGGDAAEPVTGDADAPPMQEEPVVPAEPEPIYNPLTGRYDLDADRAGKRPFAVSINNNEFAWPQYGTSAADIIYEIETEGGITRMMCLFSDPDKAPTIGSIRSLRDQFVKAIMQLDPVIVHIGASDRTTEYIGARGITTMNGYYNESFIYIHDRIESYASEHCKFTDSALLQKGFEYFDSLDRAWAPTVGSAFPFAAEGTEVVPAEGTANRVQYDFSYDGYYDGDFRYDAASGLYAKYQRGEAQIDANNNEQLQFENVLLLFGSFWYTDTDPSLTVFEYTYGGTGFYFSKGGYETFTWEKESYDTDFTFTKADGTPLVMNPGRTHVGIVGNHLTGRLVIE